VAWGEVVKRHPIQNDHLPQDSFQRSVVVEIYGEETSGNEQIISIWTGVVPSSPASSYDMKLFAGVCVQPTSLHLTYSPQNDWADFNPEKSNLDLPVILKHADQAKQLIVNVKQLCRSSYPITALTAGQVFIKLV
jgi:hypothetical protein